MQLSTKQRGFKFVFRKDISAQRQDEQTVKVSIAERTIAVYINLSAAVQERILFFISEVLKDFKLSEKPKKV